MELSTTVNGCTQGNGRDTGRRDARVGHEPGLAL